MISIAIKTALREHDYLNTTLENLERGGVFESRHLVGKVQIIDTSRSKIRQRISSNLLEKVRVNSPDRDEWRTLQQNAQIALEAASQRMRAKWVLVLEDDIDVCKNFLESVYKWLQDHKSKRRRMYVFGANYQQILNAVQEGKSYWDYPVGAFYGAQACAWTREDAASIAAWLGSDPDYNGARNNGHDMNLQVWGRQQNLNFFRASAPSFVQHIGERSGINNRFFQFLSWPGRDWVYKSNRR